MSIHNEPNGPGGDINTQLNVAKKSTAATSTIIRAVLNLMTNQKLLTRDKKTPEFDAAMKELVREIEVAVRTHMMNYGNAVAEKVKTEMPTGQGQPKRETGNRSKFLLRLMAGKFSHLFANKEGKSILPREAVMGFDDYLFKLLGEGLYEELNVEAQDLLSWFDTDDDVLIWNEISGNDRHKRFAYNILIRILLKFENFAWARKNFISIVNNITESKSGVYFEDQHFQLVFNALFSDIFKAMWDDDESVKLDFMFGGGTVGKIDQIREDFKAYKEKWTRRQRELDGL